MREQHLPDSEIQLQSSTNERLQQHLPFLCHLCSLAACSFPKQLLIPTSVRSSSSSDASAPSWTLLTETLLVVITHKSNSHSTESWENVFILLCIWISSWLSRISCDLVCRHKLDTIEFQIAEVWVLWQHVFIIVQVVTEVPQDCFVDGVQLELQTFGLENEFLKSLFKIPPKQDCQTVLCTSFLTHYQLATFSF